MLFLAITDSSVLSEISIGSHTSTNAMRVWVVYLKAQFSRLIVEDKERFG